MSFLALTFLAFFYLTRLILRAALRRFNRLSTADVTLTPFFKVIVTISVVISVGIVIAISVGTAISVGVVIGINVSVRTAISVNVSVVISISVSVNAAISINITANTGVIINTGVVTGIKVITGIKTMGIGVTNAAVNTIGGGTGVIVITGTVTGNTGGGTGVTLSAVGADTIATIGRLLLSRKSSSSSLLKLELKLDSATVIGVTLTVIARDFLSVGVRSARPPVNVPPLLLLLSPS